MEADSCRQVKRIETGGRKLSYEKWRKTSEIVEYLDELIMNSKEWFEIALLFYYQSRGRHKWTTFNISNISKENNEIG